MKKPDKSKTQKAISGIIIGLYGIPIIIMLVRFVLSLVDASISISFVRFWYEISDTIYEIFEGTFNDVILGSIVIEVDTLLCLLTLAVGCLLTLKFSIIFFRENLRGVLLSLSDFIFRVLEVVFLYRIVLKFFFADFSQFHEFILNKTEFAYDLFKNFFPSISIGTYVFEFPSFVFLLILISLNFIVDRLIKQVFKVGSMPTEHVDKVNQDSPLKQDGDKKDEGKKKVELKGDMAAVQPEDLEKEKQLQQQLAQPQPVLQPVQPQQQQQQQNVPPPVPLQQDQDVQSVDVQLTQQGQELDSQTQSQQQPVTPQQQVPQVPTEQQQVQPEVSPEEMQKLAQPHDSVPNPDIQALQTGRNYYDDSNAGNDSNVQQGQSSTQQPPVPDQSQLQQGINQPLGPQQSIPTQGSNMPANQPQNPNVPNQGNPADQKQSNPPQSN